MQNKPLVLIIDDEEDIISILTFLLKRNGMETLSAKDGIEALELIKQHQFSGIVSDLLMPKMDGIQLLKIIRAHGNNVPFIFLSGHANSFDEHVMFNYGAYELIHKPDIDKVPEGLQKLFKTNHEIQMLQQSGNEAEEFLELLHDSKKMTG